MISIKYSNKNIKEKVNPPQTIKDPKIRHGKRWSCKDAGVYAEGLWYDIREAISKLIEPYDPALAKELLWNRFYSMKEKQIMGENTHRGIAVLNANTEDEAEWIWDNPEAQPNGSLASPNPEDNTYVVNDPKYWKDNNPTLSWAATERLILKCIDPRLRENKINKNLKENITVRIGSEENTQSENPGILQSQDPNVFQPEKKSGIQINLKVRKTLDGDIIISDHNRIDICVSPKKMKVFAFAKSGDFSDQTYASQNRFFEFLLKKGILEIGSVKGTNIYGGFEANMIEPEDEIPIDQIVILNIKKWLDEEKPAMDFEKQYENAWMEYLTAPDEDEVTELGEVSQEEEKGTLDRRGLTGHYAGTWW